MSSDQGRLPDEQRVRDDLLKRGRLAQYLLRRRLVLTEFRAEEEAMELIAFLATAGLLGEDAGLPERIQQVAAQQVKPPHILNDAAQCVWLAGRDAGIAAVSAALRAAPTQEGVVMCHAGRDGDCNWTDCPQERDHRRDYQRHCPLDLCWHNGTRHVWDGDGESDCPYPRVPAPASERALATPDPAASS